MNKEFNRDCTTCLYLPNCDDAFTGYCSEYMEKLKDPRPVYPEGSMSLEEYVEKINAKSDEGKSKLSLVPTDIIWAIAAIREYGNNKYPDGGPDNWKSVERERYIDACYRHWLRFVDDPTGVDKESGLPHLWHCACNIAFLCEQYGPELRNKC